MDFRSAHGSRSSCQPLFALLLLAAALVGPSPAQALPVLGDLNLDWSDAANPNGPWTYREGTNALPSVADWTPLGSPVTQPAWAPSATSGFFLPAWMKSTTDNPGGLDILTGDVFVHSTDLFNGTGFGTANVTWTAPGNATLHIGGSMWMARDIGRANDWSILLNGVPLTGGSISSGDPFDRANPMGFDMGSGGAAALQNIAVTAGDVVELSVVRTTGSGDFSGVTMTLELVPEPAGPMLLVLGLLGVLLRAVRAGPLTP